MTSRFSVPLSRFACEKSRKPVFEFTRTLELARPSRPRARASVCVRTGTREGVCDLNFRRSNEVDYTTEGRKGRARGKMREATVRRRHVVRIWRSSTHAPIMSCERAGRKRNWKSRFLRLHTRTRSAKAKDFFPSCFSPLPYVKTYPAGSFEIRTVTSRLVSALRSMISISILIGRVTRGVSFRFINSFNNWAALNR